MVELNTPGVGGLPEVVQAVREWQCDGAPVQLHPGDIGWFWRLGAEETAAAIRTWRRDGELFAVGLLDAPTVLRMAIAPDARCDQRLARRILADVTRPEAGVLPAGQVSIEARSADALRGLLVDSGWELSEAWSPLCRDLATAVEDPGVRIVTVGRAQAHVRAAIQRAAFERSSFTDASWQAMADGLPYADARCLVAFDDRDNAVAAATVWSAGPRRPGLLEPMGVHREYRRHGYGRAISVAAAAVLRELGASSATVCTPTANGPAVATYRSAGFQALPDAPDLQRRENA